MDDNDSMPDDLSPDHFSNARLAFMIKPGDVEFQCTSKPRDLNDILRSEVTVEQVIRGQSTPVNNKRLLVNSVYQRQPFINRVFEGRPLSLVIREVPRSDPLATTYFISTRYDREGKRHSSLHWYISDRSLYTRLVAVLSSQGQFFCSVFLSHQDQYYRAYAEGAGQRIPDMIRIERLTIIQRG